MHVSVVEARQQALPGCIDYVGVGSAPGIHLLPRSDGNDPFAEDGNRLSLGARRIDGPNVRVLDDGVRSRSSLREHAQCATENDRDLQETAFHFFSRLNSGSIKTRSGMICGHPRQ
jgi:hypothetical protein